MSREINSELALSSICRKLGLLHFEELMEYVQKLPYGRTSDRTDLSNVLLESKGTCSSKHALLKKVAQENDFDGLKLILAMYRMNEINTPGIGKEVAECGLSFIPEAHCFLEVDDQRIDLTSLEADLSRIEEDILQEWSIDAEDVIDKKILMHKEYLRNWLKNEQIPFTFEEIWALREQCIKNLSQNNG